MPLLLDTHIVIALLERRIEDLPASMREVVQRDDVVRVVSVASLWEIAIKSRIGKLELFAPLSRWPEAIEQLGLAILAIDDRHVLMPLEPEPDIRDPFDRLLLGICACQGFELITVDRMLAHHPLAWRSSH